MNGAHDLGGMHGLGPINPEPEAQEPVFHAAWERRMFGLMLAAGFLGQWNIDKSRYARERQHPHRLLAQHLLRKLAGRTGKAVARSRSGDSGGTGDW